MLKKWIDLCSTRGLSYFTLWYLYAQTLIQLLQVNQFVGSTLDICQPHCNIERLWMPHWTWPSTAASVHPPGDIVSCFVTSYDTVWHCWVANYQIGPSHFFCKFLGNVSSCTLLLIIILLSRAVLASLWSKSEPEHIGEVQPVLIILKCICKRRQRAKQPCRSFKFWSSSSSPPLSTFTQCTDPMHACSASLAAQQPSRWISSLIWIKSETLPQSRVSRIINDNVSLTFSWSFSERFC